MVTAVLDVVVVLAVVVQVLVVIKVVKGTCSGSVTVGIVPLHSSSSFSIILSSTVGMSLNGLSKPKNGFESINGFVFLISFLISLLSSHLASVISSTLVVILLSVVQVSLLNGLNGFCDEFVNLLLNGVVF